MKNWNIGTRLVGGFALVLALAVLMTGLGLWRLNVVAQATAQMTDVPLSKERMISDWYRFVYSGVRRTTAVVKSSDPSLGPFFAADAAASTKDSGELQKKIEPLLTTPREKALWQEIMARRKDYLSTRDASTKAKGDGNADEATRIFEGQYIPASNKYMEVIQQLLEMQRDSINATATDIESVYTESRNLLIGLCVLVIALAGVASLWLTRGITRPLARAVEAARQVASGNLTNEIQVTSKDETGQLLQALKDMNGELVRMISKVRGGIDTIATASGQIAAGNQDLSSRTEEQASSLEETASSMEELTSTVKQNADNARQANQLALTASGVAEKGGEVVSQVVTTMGSINASSRKIVDIINVIDGIAFQTNILALNAAVEAARAGEQGRGFAVVAAEVRTLAQRSSNAAKEIKSLIDDSVDKVEAGSRLVNQAGVTMEEVVGSVKRVTDIMAEIMAASQEQSAGIEQVNQAITQMDQVTQQNAALVEESAAAADSMQQQASTLSQAVAVFRIESRQAPMKPLESSPARGLITSVSAQPKSAKVALQTPARKMISAPVKDNGGDWEEF